MSRNHYQQEIRIICSKIRGIAFLVKSANRNEQTLDLNDVCYGIGVILSEQVEALQSVADQIENDDLLKFKNRRKGV